MTYSCFIDTAYIKHNSPVISYVQDDELQPFIKVAQDIHIQRILGTNLFEYIQGLVPGPFTGLYETLVYKYIQPATMYWTISEYLLYSHYKFTNKGISVQNSTDSTSAAPEQVSEMRNSMMNTAEYFSQRVTQYLLANVASFPLYFGGSIDQSTILPKTRNYFSGIYTGRGRWNGLNGCTDCANEVHDWTFIDITNRFR